jgi:hypothetical protein
MRGKNNSSDAQLASLQAAIDKYRNICVQLLKEVDQAYTSNGTFIPHYTTTLGTLLEYLPALVADGDLTKAEGKRMKAIINRQFS